MRTNDRRRDPVPRAALAARALAAACATAALAAALAAPPARADEPDARETESRVVDLGAAAGDARIVVDNVFGPIRIEGWDGRTVEIEAIRSTYLERRGSLDEARRDVRLAVERDGNDVLVLVDGPFRDRADRRRWRQDFRWDPGYTVHYDLRLRVPRGVAFDVATVNDGDIAISGVEGDFRVRNVNGSVTLEGLRGSGTATTVNGPIVARFDRAPAGDCRFKTVNGRLDTSFPPGLSADFEFETMNGEILSDFPVELLPARVETDARARGGRIRIERRGAARIGGGGPVHVYETLNGDILIREN